MTPEWKGDFIDQGANTYVQAKSQNNWISSRKIWKLQIFENFKKN